MQPKPWEILSTRRDSSYRVFSIRTDRARSPRNGSVYDFYILESNPWVNVIPVTAQGEVVLIRQYRHGIRDLTIEIPGGLVEGGDTPEQAAWRELREETGFSAKEMIPLGFVHPNPAIQNNECYTFLAKDAFEAGRQQQDGAEDIQTFTVPLGHIPQMIARGEITHALVIVAFYKYFFEHEKRWHLE